MDCVKEKIADRRVLELVEKFLQQGVMETGKGWSAATGGTPQGAVISPLLANIYLNPLDHRMAGPEKTRIVEATQRGGFDFLGWHFERGYKWPREKSCRRLKEAVRRKTARSSGQSMKAIIADVNRTLRGWGH
jgi:RNA-directed DNA polymerase